MLNVLQIIGSGDLGRAYFQLFQIGLSQMASMRKLPLSQVLNGEKKPLIQISEGRVFQEEENNRCKDLRQT